jgi:tRNA A-37 threonylcarbamoyl transferase component Bud32
MSNLKSGLSGCKIEFTSPNILKKYSSSKEYNSRLLEQIDKQILFSNFILKNIDTPKVLNVQKEDLYSFEMEYIPASSFNEYFSSSCIKDVDFVVETLFEYFDFLILNKKSYSIENQVIEKITSLENKTNYKKYLDFLKEYVREKKICAPRTFCHGDLTFSNILFHKNRLFFLDFLDSYVDSFLCDIVKLKQDLHYMWNIKIQNIKSLRIKQIYQYIWNKLYKKYYEYIESDSFQVLDAINSLRIEPYLTNQLQRVILDDIIKNSNLYAKFNCANGGEVF